MKKLKVLLLDDDKLHGQILYEKMISLNYQNVEIANTYKQAHEYILENQVDLYLLDFYLDKGRTGLELVNSCLPNNKEPIIFFSSFYDDTVLDQIKSLNLVGFLPKTASLFDIQKSIELLVEKSIEEQVGSSFSEFLLVKKGKDLIRITIDDFEYIEVDGKYLIIYIGSEKFLIRSTLSDLVKRLPNNFLRIHQSFVINLKLLDKINLVDNLAYVKGATLPISRNYKKTLISTYYKS